MAACFGAEDALAEWIMNNIDSDELERRKRYAAYGRERKKNNTEKFMLILLMCIVQTLEEWLLKNMGSDSFTQNAQTLTLLQYQTIS